MTNWTDTATLSGQGSLAASVPPALTSHRLSEELSGVVLAQIREPADNDDLLAVPDWIFQEFDLPDNFARGDKIPPLTGLQVFSTIEQGYARYATLDFRLDVYKLGVGWISIASATAAGTSADSATTDVNQGVWFDLYFEPVDISRYLSQGKVNSTQFRFGVRGRTPIDTTIDKVAEYVDPQTLLIDNIGIPIVPTIAPGPLKEGRQYPFTYESGGVTKHYVLYVEAGTQVVHYGEQQGVSGVWTSVPDPLVVHGKAYHSDGVNKIIDSDEADIAVMFRLLAATADSGTDFLGNVYRSLVITSDTDSAYWLSKPNPSKFAVESRYFDVRDGRDPVVIDRMLLNPITPGIWASVYFSNDPIPGTDEASWEHLLWERIPYNFHCTQNQVHAFPQPITAKYVKVEFSHLQARYYAPGNFQKAITYKKYPKWVLDYYLALYDTSSHSVSASNTVVYDALDLAYNYYLDDLQTSPDSPTTTESVTNVSALTTFLASDTEDSQIDQQTLSQIKTSFRPFLNTPFAQGKSGFLLNDYIQAPNPSNYSVESILEASTDTTQVSSLDRDRLVLEKNFPVMSFYLTCRHAYRVSVATFENDRAYFAGVKDIVFTREHYASKFDQDFYLESVGDNLNVQFNDFFTIDNSWVPYDAG